MLSYFEISGELSYKISHNEKFVVLEIMSDEHHVVAAIPPEDIKLLQTAFLNYCPGMPGSIKFHEERLK